MDGDEYKIPLYYSICETLEDDDLERFMFAIEEYLASNYGSSDYYIAHMDKSKWKIVHRYFDELDKIYEEEGEP